jgi:hypothetical protein
MSISQSVVQRLREGGTNSYDEFLLLRLFATQFKHDADCQFLFEIRAFPIMLRRRMPRGNAGDGTNHGSFTFSSSPPPTPHVHQRKGSISGISAARHLDELFHQRAESKETALKQRLQNEYQHLPTIASGIIMRLLALTSVSTETSLKKSMPGSDSILCKGKRKHALTIFAWFVLSLSWQFRFTRWP